MSNKIIVVDDEQDFLDSIRRGLMIGGFRDVSMISDPRKAMELLEVEQQGFDLALIDVTMPNVSGVELLEFIKTKSPETECLMVTASNDAKTAVKCLKKGAYDYLIKPITRDDLLASVNRVLEKRKLEQLLEVAKYKTVSREHLDKSFDPILTQSESVLLVLKEAELHAQSDIPILLTGESGTGKDLLARAIHYASHRQQQTFTPVNMAAINSNLFEAEFLGHTKGAFTGANCDRRGYLAQTDGGTLFMDEIGSTPMEFQGKLLRILQEGEYRKLGSSDTKKVNIRFISATNMNLESLMAQGKFRRDFYYRLRGALLHLPPLRERREDISFLAHHFLKEFAKNPETAELDDSVIQILMNYHFPGNVRELKSTIQFASNLAQNGKVTPKCLPRHLHKISGSGGSKKVRARFSRFQSLDSVIKNHILQTYKDTDKNKMQTAKHLGIGINTLRRKLKLYGVE